MTPFRDMDTFNLLAIPEAEQRLFRPHIICLQMNQLRQSKRKEVLQLHTPHFGDVAPSVRIQDHFLIYPLPDLIANIGGQGLRGNLLHLPMFLMSSPILDFNDGLNSFFTLYFIITRKKTP